MLETIWFLLWGLLWAIYFMLDGFDLGLGTLRPFIARNDTESRIIYNVMGPFWDGNEVWLITAGGVTFAAFPTTYAVMFSTLYAPLLLILFGLIIRASLLRIQRSARQPWVEKDLGFMPVRRELCARASFRRRLCKHIPGHPF